ncbi:MAG: enoyl-CoA hydratase/isomerase family protein [Gammaproteobacteria bacterium]|nr:enoyl-CoA hydratase/isomerase family protein [Gammaproteobacteria bacterium]
MSGLPSLTDTSLVLDGRVAVLTFRRHDVRNALTSTEIVTDIVATLNWANNNSAVSVVILTGEGTAFSAGGNIKTMSEHTKAPAFELQGDYKRDIQRIPRALQSTGVPVIAAVNGAAIGAGFDLANMCDIRIGSTDARFCETFVNLGIVPAIGGAWFLQRLVGYQRAAEITLTGRMISAAEALQLGILMEVTQPDALLSRAHEIAAAIAAKPPLAVRYAKQLLKLAQSQPLAEHLEVCSAIQALCHKTEDHAEALQAFLEKRPGDYKGR